MEQHRFIGELCGMAEERAIPLSAEQALICYEHVALMLQWNQRLNLTRITDFHEILTKHLLDSLIPTQWLPKEGTAMDVGTGPGFPGIPLGILRPELRMSLLESHRKKVSFLKVLLSKLALSNLRVLQGRLEEWDRTPPPGLFRTCSLVVTRAVHLEPNYFRTIGRRILAPEGILAWWAGPEDIHPPWSPEIAQDTGLTFEASHAYTLPPPASRPRRLLLWRATPSIETWEQELHSCRPANCSHGGSRI